MHTISFWKDPIQIARTEDSPRHHPKHASGRQKSIPSRGLQQYGPVNIEESNRLASTVKVETGRQRHGPRGQLTVVSRRRNEKNVGNETALEFDY
eukprot:scaffold4392_cov63-Cyclotella_meneghiniana.AAC.14